MPSSRAPVVLAALCAVGCGLVSGLDALVVDGGQPSDAGDAQQNDVVVDQTAPVDAVAPDGGDAGSALSSVSACSFISGTSPLSLTSKDFTIELWLQIHALVESADVEPILWNGGRSTTEPGWTLALTSQGLELCIADSTAAKCSTTYPPTIGDLVHVGIISTVSGPRIVELFVRDVTAKEGSHMLRGQLVNGLVDWSTTSTFTIGGAKLNALCSSTPSFVIDDLRFYDSALTPTQLDSDMGAIACSTPNLLAYFKFDEGAGLVANDCTAKLVLTLGQSASFVTSPFP
jgi:hypothetical protein